MGAFLRGKGTLIWEVTQNPHYVIPDSFLLPGSRDMFEANSKAVDYLFRALCASKFDRVYGEDVAGKIWLKLRNAHVRNAQVQACMYTTYRREYENFTHLPGESTDAMFQRFTCIVNNMRANVTVVPYTDHDQAIKILHALDRSLWSAKVEAIEESSVYDTLTLDELFSKLRSS